EAVGCGSCASNSSPACLLGCQYLTAADAAVTALSSRGVDKGAPIRQTPRQFIDVPAINTNGRKESAMENRESQHGLSRRDFLVATTLAAAMPVARASAQTRNPRLGGTFISAKTTEAPTPHPNLQHALSPHPLDPP